jgi:hypothetical protein
MPRLSGHSGSSCAGGYEVQEKSTGEKQFYRFQKPTNADYPFMLELFSRQPDVLQVADGSHLTPLPVEEDASSLSAILLDNDYICLWKVCR